MNWWNRQKKAASSGVSVEYGVYSDVGRTRSENEDAYGIYPGTDGDVADRLFVVADGMGGHERGREASTTAVQAMQHAYFDPPDRPATERLIQAFQAANAEVYRMAREDGAGTTMGTTATALAVVGERAYVAHVGDSRAYRIAGEDIEQLTQDHTMVDAMRREGLLTAQEARHHPKRGALTRAIGTEPRAQVDIIDAGALRAGDRFLLCSDGLGALSEAELREVVRDHAPQAACEQLVERANARGGYDNATALVVHVQ